MDFRSIEAFIKSLDSNGLQYCQNIITREINTRPSPSHPEASEMVEYHRNFVERESTLNQTVQEDIATLSFNMKTPSEAVQNRFVSIFKRPYVWDSTNGKVKNEAAPMDNYPGLRGIMDKINSTFGLKMNSVLVSCYVNGKVAVRAHDDGEAELDSEQPIVVVSFGASRKVEFTS